MGAMPMNETQHTEQLAEKPAYTLASPEFFHLLQRIELTETSLRGEIKQLETVLRGEITGLRGEITSLRSWVIATLVAVALSTVGLALFR